MFVATTLGTTIESASTPGPNNDFDLETEVKHRIDKFGYQYMKIKEDLQKSGHQLDQERKQSIQAYIFDHHDKTRKQPEQTAPKVKVVI